MTKEIRCLIVDDEPKNVKTLSKRLDSLGHKYEVAQDQQSALNFIKRKGKWLHYVLLDLKLKVNGNDNDPDSSTGLELLRQVREIHPQDRLPILVITAYEGNVKTAVEVMKIGANDFIVRDSPQKDLINKILAMLDHKGSDGPALYRCEDCLRAVNSHEALLRFAKEHHEVCADCEGTGKIYNNADPTSGQWVACPYAEAIALAEGR